MRSASFLGASSCTVVRSGTLLLVEVVVAGCARTEPAGGLDASVRDAQGPDVPQADVDQREVDAGQAFGSPDPCQRESTLLNDCARAHPEFTAGQRQCDQTCVAR